VNGLVILNIEDPSNPTFASSSCDTASTTNHTAGTELDSSRRVIISGNYAYVADSKVLELSNSSLVILEIGYTSPADCDEGISSIGIIATVVSVGLIALFRRK